MQRCRSINGDNRFARDSVLLDLLLKLVNVFAETGNEGAVDGFVKISFFVVGKNRCMQKYKFVGSVNIPYEFYQLLFHFTFYRRGTCRFLCVRSSGSFLRII